MHSWGKFWTTRYKKTKKKKKTQLPFLNSLKQKQNVRIKSMVPHMPPVLKTRKGWANHLSHPYIHLDWSFFNTVLGWKRKEVGHGSNTIDSHCYQVSALTTYKEQACSASVSKQENLLLVFAPPASAGAPIKPCLISCLASGQFILIGDGQKPWSI